MFVRQDQLAKEMGVSVSTLWRWRRDGKCHPLLRLVLGSWAGREKTLSDG